MPHSHLRNRHTPRPLSYRSVTHNHLLSKPRSSVLPLALYSQVRQVKVAAAHEGLSLLLRHVLRRSGHHACLRAHGPRPALLHHHLLPQLLLLLQRIETELKLHNFGVRTLRNKDEKQQAAKISCASQLLNFLFLSKSYDRLSRQIERTC